MTAPQLKLVNDETEREFAEAADNIAANGKALMKGGPLSAELLPPGGNRYFDDLGNAERFLDMFGSDLLFAVEAKKWLIWEQTNWNWDKVDIVFSYISMFARSLYAPENLTDKSAIAHAVRSNNRSGLEAVLKLVQRKKATTITDFDTQPRLLNCKNGTLELKTGELRPHNKEDRITRRVDCDYIPAARSAVFERFIERIQPDPEIRSFLQRSIGYSLLGSVRERSFWILYGTGNNGKSIFTNLFNNLLGEYAATTTTATIMAGKQSGIPNDIARLKGKRFVVVPETEENERMNAALVKALSAGDKVSARFLFCEYFDFEFSAKLWIATNHKPTITDHSKGFWDRIKLVPFAEDIPAAEVVKSDDLMAALMADAPAVLAWAVQGARDYFERDGLDTPPVIQAEIDAYRKEQDSIAQFLEEKCQTIEEARVIRPDGYFSDLEFRIPNGDIYAAYEKFCKANGEYQRNQRRFSQNLIERGFKKGNSGGRYWEGIRLTGIEML